MDNWILMSFFWAILLKDKTAIGLSTWQPIEKNTSLIIFDTSKEEKTIVTYSAVWKAC